MAIKPKGDQFYDTDLVSTLDLDYPQKEMNEIFRPYGDQGKTYLFIRSLGFERSVGNDDYLHYEKDKSHVNFKQSTSVGAVTQAGAGLPLTISIDSTDLDASNKYYLRKGDNVITASQVRCYVKEEPTVTTGGLGGGVDLVEFAIYPNKITDTIGTIASGEVMSIYSGTSSEKSGFPKEATAGSTQFSNTAKIVKENVGTTGTQLVTESWIKAYNKAGEMQGWYAEAMVDIDYRILLKLDGMFFLDYQIDNTASRAVDSVTGYPVKGTMGLDDGVETYGNVETYTTGAFAITDFDTYDKILRSNYIHSDVPIWFPMALDLYQEVENALKTYFADTNINYVKDVLNARLFKGDASLGASVNFKYLQKSDRCYMFNALDNFNNPETYNSTGHTWQGVGYGIPIHKKKDPVTGDDIPSFGTRYRSKGEYNRKFILERQGGVGASHNPVHEIDKQNTYIMCHMGCEFFGLNQFIKVKPA